MFSHRDTLSTSDLNRVFENKKGIKFSAIIEPGGLNYMQMVNFRGYMAENETGRWILLVME